MRAEVNLLPILGRETQRDSTIVKINRQVQARIVLARAASAEFDGNRKA